MSKTDWKEERRILQEQSIKRSKREIAEYKERLYHSNPLCRETVDSWLKGN